MKLKRNFFTISALCLIICLSITCLSGCEWFKSKTHSLKGSLKGLTYNIETYDNYGTLTQTTSGENIDIEGNKVEEIGFDSSGNTITNYSLSSVITITIDGHEMESCGDTVIFAESGLKKDVDFTLPDIESSNEKGLAGYTAPAKLINKYKNYFGKSRVVVIKSQMGVPICAYSGESVYWEIPDDLPKTTKLSIDGKTLYIHRANFTICDLALID